MLRITGNLPDLLVLADRTGSEVQLRERLDYLNNWGEGHGVAINVDVMIYKVNLDREEADVSVYFYTGDDKPTPWHLGGAPAMVGGLNLHKEDAERFNWSVNT